MTDDWLIDCWLCFAHVGKGGHTCFDVSHCFNIWLDRKGQEILNGELGHMNGRTRPSGHETNNETWDSRFSRWWKCKLVVVSNMSPCSLVGRYRFVGGKQMPPSSRTTKEPASFSESLIITYEPIESRIMNTLRIGLPVAWYWTERTGNWAFCPAKKLYSTGHTNVEDGRNSFLNEEHRLYSPNIILVMKSRGMS